MGGDTNRGAMFKKYFSKFAPNQPNNNMGKSGKRELPEVNYNNQENNTPTETKIEGLLQKLPQDALNNPNTPVQQLNQQQINDLLNMMINVVQYDIDLHNGDDYTVGIDMSGSGKKLDSEGLKKIQDEEDNIKEMAKGNKHCKTFVKSDGGYECVKCKKGFLMDEEKMCRFDKEAVMDTVDINEEEDQANDEEKGDAEVDEDDENDEEDNSQEEEGVME